jgi:hypothetical protein
LPHSGEQNTLIVRAGGRLSHRRPSQIGRCRILLGKRDRAREQTHVDAPRREFA